MAAIIETRCGRSVNGGSGKAFAERKLAEMLRSEARLEKLLLERVSATAAE
jgi:hypothetical protein